MKGSNQVRIAGGRHGGRSVRVPRGARPTEGRVREALFSIWTAPLAEGARFLDLFAGSGVVGPEAAGRGALEVVMVESNRRAIATLEANRDELDEGLVEVRRLELPAGLARLAGRRFDLVFADPPYAWDGHGELLAALVPLVADLGEVAVEHSARGELPAVVAGIGAEVDPDRPEGGLVRVDSRRYGETALTFYRPGPG